MILKLRCTALDHRFPLLRSLLKRCLPFQKSRGYRLGAMGPTKHRFDKSAEFMLTRIFNGRYCPYKTPSRHFSRVYAPSDIQWAQWGLQNTVLTFQQPGLPRPGVSTNLFCLFQLSRFEDICSNLCSAVIATSPFALQAHTITIHSGSKQHVYLSSHRYRR